MTETEKTEVEKAHAQNLQDEAKRQATKAADDKRKERERKDKDNARKKAWRAAKKAALDSTKARRAAPSPKPKGKAKPAAKASKPKRGAFDPANKITVLVDKNPKRPGTDSARRFDKYRTGMTVADYFAKGGAAPDLLWDIERKFIKVAS